VRCNVARALQGAAPVTDDKFDPRPNPDQFARVLAARAAAAPGGPDPTRWLSGWHDREGVWTNLRNAEHWIERAGA
jgi:hypothetical protein